jgi:hypothetical protein
MSKQYNKAEKRQRRQKYIKRKTVATRTKPKAKAAQTAAPAA